MTYRSAAKYRVSAIQAPNPIVQIRRKRHPKQIWDLQQSSSPICFPERNDHAQDQGPQDQQPDQRRAKRLKIEKEYAPEEIECQLKEKKHQTARPRP